MVVIAHAVLFIQKLCSKVRLSAGMLLGIGMHWEESKTETPPFISSCCCNFKQSGLGTLQLVLLVSCPPVQVWGLGEGEADRKATGK